MNNFEFQTVYVLSVSKYCKSWYPEVLQVMISGRAWVILTSIYDWVEIHIDLQGGELAFTPRQGFWL